MKSGSPRHEARPGRGAQGAARGVHIRPRPPGPLRAGSQGTRLNHANIGSIYGLEEAEGIRALVLELVEGPTLADRIRQGPIPVDEALAIATQIAEALEAAHEAGVIHLDLKPANIKVKDEWRTNEPPMLSLAVDQPRSVRVGDPLTLVIFASDDGIPSGRYTPPAVEPGKPHPAYRAPLAIVPGNPPGFRFSWIVYRGGPPR